MLAETIKSPHQRQISPWKIDETIDDTLTISQLLKVNLFQNPIEIEGLEAFGWVSEKPIQGSFSPPPPLGSKKIKKPMLKNPNIVHSSIDQMMCNFICNFEPA